MGNCSCCSCCSCCGCYKGDDTIGIVAEAENVGTEGTYRSISEGEDLEPVQNGQYEPVYPPEHAETPEDTPHRPGKGHVCVAGYHQKFLQSVYKAINTTVNKELLNIIKTKLTTQTADDPSTFQGADMIVLVATSSQRLMLISDKEESQMGKAYNTAKNLGDVFLILAGHTGSSDLAHTELYSSSLNQAFKNQPALGQLAGNDRFISVGYTHSPEDLQFNKAQEELLRTWIHQHLK